MVLRCRRRPRGERVMTATARRLGRRSNRGGELGLHGDSGFRRDFSARGTAAGVELDLAKPREVAAQEGNGRGDG